MIPKRIKYQGQIYEAVNLNEDSSTPSVTVRELLNMLKQSRVDPFCKIKVADNGSFKDIATSTLGNSDELGEDILNMTIVRTQIYEVRIDPVVRILASN